ncbi:MAG: hypothetical protein V1921_07660 [Candidatus Altiarchaeota archaeon]
MKKGGKKTGKENRGMIYLIIVVMLFSAFFVFTNTTDYEQPEEAELNLDQYSVVVAGNETILAVITGKTDEYVLMPARSDFLQRENLLNIQESAIDGVSEVRIELSDAYLMVKFEVNNLTAALPAIERLARSELGKYTLHRAYVGKVGKDSVYVVGETGLEIGDNLAIILFQKVVDNIPEELIGLETAKLSAGSEFDAQVLDAGRMRVFASFDRPLELGSLIEELGVENHTLAQPSFSSYGLDNGTLEKLSNEGANVTLKGEAVLLSSDDFKGLKSRLDKMKANYSIVNGTVNLLLNGTGERVEELLQANGITNPFIRREGTVSTPSGLVLDGKIIRLDNEMNAFLFPNASEGDNITVNVQIIQFGDTSLPIGAEQV